MDRSGSPESDVDDGWDGEWVDTDAPDRWEPPVSQRLRAAVILLGGLGLFLLVAIVLAVAPGGDEDVAVDEATSTTADLETAAPTTVLPTTTAPLDPASVGGTPPPERCADDDRSARPLRPLPQIEVMVLNATPRAGHAGEITEAIDALGYRTVTPGNAGREPTTIVRYTEGWCAEADRLATELRLPEARLELVPRGEESELGSSDLVVVLGSDSL